MKEMKQYSAEFLGTFWLVLALFRSEVNYGKWNWTRSSSAANHIAADHSPHSLVQGQERRQL